MCVCHISLIKYCATVLQTSHVLSVPVWTTHEAAAVGLDSCLRQLTSIQTTHTADDAAVISCVRCRQQLVDNVVGGRDLLTCCMLETRTTHSANRGYQSRSMISYCPPYLIIRLRRAGPCTRCMVPCRLLLGNDVVMTTGSAVHEYQLRALCCHAALSYVTPNDVTWFGCDDVTSGGGLQPVNIDDELASESVQRQVSLLFYRLIPSS